MAPVLSAVPSEPPLFAAFLHFCARTSLDFDAISKAAEAAGATSFPMLNVSNSYPMRQGHWKLRFRDQDFRIDASSQHRPDVDPPHLYRGCSLMGDDEDQAGAKAITDWVGVPPIVEMPGRASTFIYFERNGRRVAVPAEQDRLLEEKDGFWSLSVAAVEKRTFVDLRHQRPERR